MRTQRSRHGARIRIDADGRTMRHIPLADLILQTELRVATMQNITAFYCPCQNCHGGRRQQIPVIREHLAAIGRDPFLTKSIIGGDPADGYPADGIWVEDIAYDNDVVHDGENADADDILEDVVHDVPRQDDVNEDAIPLDEFHDVQRQVMDALERGDALHRDAGGEPNVLDNDELNNDTVDELHNLYAEATTPLYPGAKTSVVSATIVLMNMCVVFGVSNTFRSELLRYLGEDLLPKGNKLPKSHYAAAKTIRKLGLDYNNIHACPDGCVLYEDDHAELQTCPQCSKSRWLEGTNCIPAKVIRHFPLIPRLQRMWRSPEIATMLTGYKNHISNDGIMRSVVDSPAWKYINTDVAFDMFGCEDRNMRLALALDGVNPFKLSNTNWSTWPVLVLIYNLEPWFVTKKFFISLCILISGKRSPTATNIDVYLRPLLNELHQLWRGIPAQDFSQPMGSRCFNLRGLLMWTISDFPAYGLISGLSCKGYKGCPCCGPETDARMAKTGDLRPDRTARGSKIVYGGIRRYLGRHHPYRKYTRFNGHRETRTAPSTVSGLDIIRYAAWRQSYLDLGGRQGAPGDPLHSTGVKRLSAFFELPYWQVNKSFLYCCDRCHLHCPDVFTDI